MLPYCALVIWFALDYAYASYLVNEQSSSTVGLTHRWIIKGVLVFGLVVAMVSGIAAWLQGSAAPVNGSAFSPDGRLLATVSSEGTIVSWMRPS